MNTYPAEIERIIDGDTIIASLDLGLDVLIVQYIRLAGINAPERNTEAGKAAKAYVAQRLIARFVTIAIDPKRPRDKYGRILGTIGLDGKNFNQELIDQGYAVAYDGKSPATPPIQP